MIFNRPLLACLTLSLVAGLGVCNSAASPSDPDSPETPGYEARLSAHFEPNLGQAVPEVDFLSRGRGYTLLLQPDAAVLRLRNERREDDQNGGNSPKVMRDFQRKGRAATATTVRMRLVGANPDARGELIDPGLGRVNYLMGRDPRRWKREVPTYGRAHYTAIYAGIDLDYYGREGLLEYDFIVHPGADPSVIRLAFDGLLGTNGTPPLEIDAQGALVLRTASGEIRKPRPTIYQERGGKRIPVMGEYTLLPVEGAAAPEVGFRLADYDRSRPLVIDPVIVYSTYLGGSRSENFVDADIRLSSIAADADGCAYVMGTTTSADFPVTPGAFQSNYAGPDGVDYHGDLFVAKISPDGSQLVYATYLGGSRGEAGYDIAVDGSGHAYLTGATNSDDFPVLNAVQPVRSTGKDSQDAPDAFVTKLNPEGSGLIFSTYLGAPEPDGGRCITVSNQGEATVCGITFDDFFFPLVNPFQDSGDGGRGDVFVARFNAAGTALAYSSYLGGNNGIDEPAGMAVDGAGDVYIVGTTYVPTKDSNNFPVLNAVQPLFGGGFNDFFVSKVSRAGELVYSTYLGGSSTDFGKGIAVDPQGNAYITGYISSKDFPRAIENHTSFGTGQRYACVVKLNPEGSSLVYTTFIAANLGVDIGLRADGHVYVVGDTDRTYPIRTEMPPNFARGTFVARLNPTGTEIVSTSFILASAQAIAVDALGNMYLTGDVFLKNFETANAIQAQAARKSNRRTPIAEITDAFVAKITSAYVPPGGRLVVTPRTLNFGNVKLGSPPVTRKLRIKNTGREFIAALVGWTPAPFVGPATRPEFPLAPGETREIEVSFTPPAKGRFSGKLAITSTDPRKRVLNINLSGRGR